MVNATIDNNPVSISLSNGETTTVPGGQVWKVNISITYSSLNEKSSFASISINGNAVMSHQVSGGYSTGGGSSTTIETVLTASDTVSVNNGNAHIGGFVVN